jgi:hypothetical protein
LAERGVELKSSGAGAFGAWIGKRAEMPAN